jgi:MYXO-CTERM domain-containing protein
MKKHAVYIAAALILGAGMVTSTQAATTTLDFEDLDTSKGYIDLPLNYGGLTWESGAADYWGTNNGNWKAWNDSFYAIAHSGGNYLFNSYGPQELGFTLSTGADSVSAWFSDTTALNGRPGTIELVGYVGGVETYRSAALVLSSTPQQLSLFGSDITRVTVRGSSAGWYAMDDLVILSAVPEPSTTLSALVGLAVLAGVGSARRRSQAV